MSLTPGDALAFGLGFVLAGAFWVAARRAGQERRAFAVGLAVAALIYVGFALGGGASPAWTGLEVAGLGIFGGLAWAGWQGSARWLALGWALHPLWDAGIHLTGVGGEIAPAAFVPSWYAWLCLSFDLVIATASWRLGGEPSPPTVW